MITLILIIINYHGGMPAIKELKFNSMEQCQKVAELYEKKNDGYAKYDANCFELPHN
jgi:hypothetical protein